MLSPRCLLRVSFAVICLTLPNGVLAGTDDAESDTSQPKAATGSRPLAIFSCRDLNTLQQKIEFVFDAAGHPDTAGDILDSIEESTGQLAGVDRTRPAGVALYLTSVFPPNMEFVACVPVTDTDQFLRTLELGPVVATPVAEDDSRFELIGPSNTTQVRVQNGYAFLQLPIADPDQEFDRRLPDPASLARELPAEADVAVTLDVDSIPRMTRQLLKTLISSTLSTQMQQRDNESTGLYQIRRSWMQGDIDALQLLLDELTRATISLQVSPERRVIDLDMDLHLRDGGELMQEILSLSLLPSRFASVIDETAVVSLSAHQQLTERDTLRLQNVLTALSEEIKFRAGTGDLPGNSSDTAPLLAGINALQATVAHGDIDYFAQCFPDSEQRPVLVAALSIRDGEQIAAAVDDLLLRLQDLEQLRTLERNAATLGEVSFHRIGIPSAPPEITSVLGESPGLTFGCGTTTMWLALGGPETEDVLTQVIDQLRKAWEQPTERPRESPMRFIVNLNEILNLVDKSRDAGRQARDQDAPNDSAEKEEELAPRARRRAARRQRFRERRRARMAIWRETLAEGQDRIELDLRQLETGLRWRIELGEGFLKGLGRAIAVSRDSDENP